MIVSFDGVRVQHLVEICGLSLAGGIGVIISTTSSDSSVKLVMVFSGLVLLLSSSPCYDCSGLTKAVPQPHACSDVQCRAIVSEVLSHPVVVLWGDCKTSVGRGWYFPSTLC